MFQLTNDEFESLKNQIDNSNSNLMSQFVTSSWGGTRRMPCAFTEQGVAMLSGVLKSERAIEMNIVIMRAFVDVRKILLKQSNIKEQLLEIKEHLGEMMFN